MPVPSSGIDPGNAVPSLLFTSLKQTEACLSDVVGEELGGEYHHLCTLGYERAAGSEFSDQKKFEATL